MKKILLTMLLMSSPLLAESYIITVDKKHYDKNIVIEDYKGNVSTPITCELPEVLNQEGTACEVPAPTCVFPEVLTDSGNACINTFDKVGWIDRTDSCKGVKPMTTNNNVLVLRANTTKKIANPIIPEGYRWISRAEYQSLVPMDGPYHNYYGQCGHAAYPNISGVTQEEITFSDTASTNRTTHSGTMEGNTAGWLYPNNWFGIAVIRDE